MNADELSDGGSRRDAETAFVPSEAWIESFEAQCSADMLKRLERFAAGWARLLGAESVGSDPYYAEELVQNALADTLAGVLHWDPTKHALEHYLTDVIRLRARRDRKRATRHEHISLDALEPDDARSPPRYVEATIAVHESQESIEMQPMTKLRELVGDDTLAQRFLDATDQDATTRADVMRIAGLTSVEYHNTRRRLARLLAQLRPSWDTSRAGD